MPLFNSSLITSAADSTPAAEDPVTRSLRYPSGSYQSFTPSSGSSDFKKWVFSCWVKRCTTGVTFPLLQTASGTDSPHNITTIHFETGDTLEVAKYTDTYQFKRNTTRVFRDPSAWTCVTVVYDSTESNEVDRIKIYINGEHDTNQNSGTDVDLNEASTFGTSGQVMRLNSFVHLASYDLAKSYQADVYFIDGSVTLPTGYSDWGSVFVEDTGYGSVKPRDTSSILSSSDFGTNGFHLKFEGGEHIGRDSSGNDNDFTATNLYPEDLFDGGQPDNTYLTFPTSNGASSDSQKGILSLWVRNIGSSSSFRLSSGDSSTYTNHDDITITPSSNELLITSVRTNYLTYVKASVTAPTGSTWKHYVIAWDYTQSTESNRIRMFEDGTQLSLTTLGSSPNQPWGNTSHDLHFFSSSYPTHFQRNYGYGGANYFDADVRDVHYMDGVSYTDSQFSSLTNVSYAFAETASGSWTHKKYNVGSNNSSAYWPMGSDDKALTRDDSGNSNTLTLNNGVSPSAVLDVPTKNYAVLNPLAQSTYSLSNGNLECIRDASSAQSYITSTIGVNSSSATTSKWYWEVYAKTLSSDYPRVGISSYYSRGGDEPTTNYLCGDTDGTGRAWASKNGSGNIVGESHPGMKFDGSNSGSAFVDYDQGDILRFALDLDNNKLWCGKNETWYTDDASTTTTASAISGNTATPAFSDLSGHTWGPAIFCNADSDVFILNAGQDPYFAGNKSSGQDTSQFEFYYAPPTGFKSLNTSNFATPTVTPSEHFDILTYTGNSDASNNNESTQNVTGVNFDVGMAWIKDRDNRAGETYTGSGENEYGNYLFDTITGTSAGGYNIDYDVTSGMGATLNSGESGVSSFSAGSGANRGITVDEAGETNFKYEYDDGLGMGESYTERYVAWLWKLGSTGSSDTWNSSYTAPTTEHYNASAGVTTIKVTPASSGNLEVAHSLSAAPEFFWVTADQGGSSFSGFPAFHKDLTSGSYLKLDGNSAQLSSSTYFPSGAAHADYIKLGSVFVDGLMSGFNLRIWAFTGVEGYSKFGTYTGNGIADGPMVFTNHTPRWILIKRINLSDHWCLYDTARFPSNPNSTRLEADTSDVEVSASTIRIDVLSNGFKLRGAGSTINATNSTYVFASFASAPFAKATAR